LFWTPIKLPTIKPKITNQTKTTAIRGSLLFLGKEIVLINKNNTAAKTGHGWLSRKGNPTQGIVLKNIKRLPVK
tara:strand:+ start:350 stop:571 length:222 start_codon:yes stop_codon:yes gene_type:complete